MTNSLASCHIYLISAFSSPAILEFFQILLLESEPSHAWYTLSSVLLLLPMYSTARGAGGGGASIRRDCPKK